MSADDLAWFRSTILASWCAAQLGRAVGVCEHSSRRRRAWYCRFVAGMHGTATAPNASGTIMVCVVHFAL